MEIQRRLYTVDDIRKLQCQPGNGDKHYELINGELIEMSPANLLHFWLASELSGEIRNYLKQHDIGYVGVEGGFSPSEDRYTLLAPDVAFVSRDKMPQPMPQTFAGFMPDLAVEIKSPGNSLRELRDKAAIYLSNGTKIVWIVLPDQKGVEVCRATEDAELHVEFADIDGKLSGEDVLPGFELELRKLFAE